MSAVSNGRVLRIALAGSLAMHLIIAAIVHSRPVEAAREQLPIKTQIIKIHMAPPTPTPKPPKPAVQHPQNKSVAVRPRMHVPKLIADTNKHSGPAVAPPVEPTGDPYPVETSGPDVAPTGAPVVATPTPKPACSAPDIPAKTVFTQTPDVPDDVRSQGILGTAKVKVDLDASGDVVGTSIYESTGSMQLDQAALAAARQSRYAPEERECKNVSGSYLFTVDFQ
jgi:periplasmic protein TonB